MLSRPQSNYKNDNDNVSLLHSIRPNFPFSSTLSCAVAFKNDYPLDISQQASGTKVRFSHTNGLKMSFAVNVSSVPEHQRCCRSGGQLEPSDDWCTTSEGTAEKCLSVYKMHHIGIDLGSGDK